MGGRWSASDPIRACWSPFGSVAGLNRHKTIPAGDISWQYLAFELNLIAHEIIHISRVSLTFVM